MASMCFRSSELAPNACSASRISCCSEVLPDDASCSDEDGSSEASDGEIVLVEALAEDTLSVFPEAPFVEANHIHSATVTAAVISIRISIVR